MFSVNIFIRCSKQGFNCPWLNVSRLTPYDISHIILMICAVVTDRGNDGVIRFPGSWRSLAMGDVNSYCCTDNRPRGEKDTARSIHHVDTWVPTLAIIIKKSPVSGLVLHVWKCLTLCLVGKQFPYIESVRHLTSVYRNLAQTSQEACCSAVIQTSELLQCSLVAV
jgi:hypothetical protein